MRLQSYNAIQEVRFLLYLTAAILGFQLAIYFFYRYYYIRDESLQLNKILLSYGFFFMLTIIGILISAINRYFMSDPILKKAFYKLGYILILLSLITFLYFILIDEFSKIINITIGRIIMVLNLIQIIIILLIPSTISPIFLFCTVFTIINLIFIILFQIRLINTSTKNIKKRLILFLVGGSLSFISLDFSMYLILNIYPSEYVDIFLFSSITILIVGIIITSYGAYNFPAFYEFKWKNNLLKLLIINQKKGNCIFSTDFTKPSELKSEQLEGDFKNLFYGGITALSTILKTSTEKINKIKQGDLFIFLEHGSDILYQITYVLIAKNDLKSNQYFLNTIKEKFEAFYKEILLSIDDLKGNEVELFGSFDIIIKNIMLQ